MTDRNANTRTPGSDICYCGDFRSEHSPRCFCGCPKFRLFHVASAYDQGIWNAYHSPAARDNMRETEKGSGNGTAAQSSTQPQPQPKPQGQEGQTD